MIDRVTEIVHDERILAIKNVTINEPFFQGHFPHVPVMPGVLVLEAMAQAAGILSFASMGRYSDANSVYYFAGIDEARFKRPVSPGDQLVLDFDAIPAWLDVELRLARMTRWVLDAEARALPYAFRLGTVRYDAANGAAHQAACLRALALYGSAEAA